IRSGGRFFHRGEDYGYDPECAEDKPVPLASILDWDEKRRNMPLARKAWLILHYNAPLTHVDVILEGLAELFPDKAAVFQEAMRLRHEAGMAVLKEIMSTGV